MIGSEAFPFAKTGGLADVLGALPQAVARLGWKVTLVLPRYAGVRAGTSLGSLRLKVGAYRTDAAFSEVVTAERARAVLVDVPELFDRPSLYGVGNDDYPDNARRFALLVRAALEVTAESGERPDLVHAHDWHAALAPVYLKTIYRDHPVLGGVPSVLTIHNLAYQGLFEADWLPRIDLPWEWLAVDRMEFWGRISLLKGGINTAEGLTTVSPRYAQEIQTAEYGCGFEGILQARADRLVGILNGIDVDAWDPSRDRHLPAPFSAADLSGKQAAKAAVLAEFRLPVSDQMLARPLIALASRLVDQKGFDLIAAIADQLPDLPATFVLLGTGERRHEDLWRRLAAAHPGRVGTRLGFDEPLVHRIAAGADILLMPSRFEPCGLNQMYGLRYGTVPLVRGTGGLADTVWEQGPPRGKGTRATGFVFHDYTPQALLEAIRRALNVFADPARWRAIQAAGMAEDHSWDRSAREYVKMYQRVAKTAAGGRRQPRRPGGPRRAGRRLPEQEP
jgi:starch synthase